MYYYRFFGGKIIFFFFATLALASELLSGDRDFSLLPDGRNSRKSSFLLSGHRGHFPKEPMVYASDELPSLHYGSLNDLVNANVLQCSSQTQKTENVIYGALLDCFEKRLEKPFMQEQKPFLGEQEEKRGMLLADEKKELRQIGKYYPKIFYTLLFDYINQKGQGKEVFLKKLKDEEWIEDPRCPLDKVYATFNKIENSVDEGTFLSIVDILSEASQSVSSECSKKTRSHRGSRLRKERSRSKKTSSHSAKEYQEKKSCSFSDLSGSLSFHSSRSTHEKKKSSS